MNGELVAAALLTGGRSRRFGSDKAWHVPPESTAPLWSLQLEKFRELGAQERIVSVGADGPTFPVPDGVRVVVDAVSDAGPLGGLTAVLASIQAPRVIVLAIDMPAVSAVALRALLAAGDSRRGLVPWRDGRWEPLLAVYPRSLAALAQERLAAGQLSLQGLIDAGLERDEITAWPVPSEAEPWFANLNRPPDGSSS